jgi:hypothetical protein
MATKAGAGGLDTRFDIALKPGGRMVVWRMTGARDCEVTVSLHGHGRLRVALRGY